MRKAVGRIFGRRAVVADLGGLRVPYTTRP